MDQIPDCVITFEIGNGLDFKSILELSLVNKRFKGALSKYLDEAKFIKEKLFLTAEDFDKIDYRSYSDITLQISENNPINFRLQPVFCLACVYMFQRGDNKGAMCGKPVCPESVLFCKICIKKRSVALMRRSEDGVSLVDNSMGDGVVPLSESILASSRYFIKYSGPSVTKMATSKKLRPDFFLDKDKVYMINDGYQLGKPKSLGKFCEIGGFKYVLQG